ncbi:MAG TPA: hypothetical protein PLL10_06520, partial [Elusimicrobiales bacterium]|nr:hypothetical protein [Elusimicrobiales bacterium]
IARRRGNKRGADDTPASTMLGFPLMKRAYLPLLLLGLSAASAFAEPRLFLREDYTFGSEGYKSNSISFSGLPGKNTLIGGEYTFYKDDTLPDVVHSFRLPLFINYGKMSGFFRPFYYPSTRALDSSAAGFTAQGLFLLESNSVNETRSQIACNVSVAGQNAAFGFADGTAPRKMLPEVTYELLFQQNYFKEFYLLLNVSAYQYLTGIKGVQFADLILDQGDISSTGYFRALRDLPQWNTGLEVNRTIGDSSDEQVYMQYHYLAFAQDYPAAHALSVGTRFKLSDTNSFDFGYNWIARGSDRKQNFYRAGFRLAF